MRQLTTTTAPEAFLGSYGQTWRTGLLTEHLELYVAAGGVVRESTTGTGASWAVVDGRAYPVVCSELIHVYTEDGRVTGRCGAPATREGCCEGHAQDHDSWRDEEDPV